MRPTPSSINASALPVLALAALSACSDVHREAESDIPAHFRDFAAQFERERQALGIPGAAVAILERGELTFARGFGTKSVDGREPVDADTIFRTGSMGKLATAIGVMSAVDDGLLELDAPVREAIPDLSLEGPEADALTLRQLLSQQSGLSDYLEVDASSEDAALAEFAAGPGLAENVGFINPPGAFWNYSNPNYYIAGRALEAQANVPYRQALDERVFSPLGMDRSFLLPSDVLADGNYSNGYGSNDERGEGPLEDLAPDAYDNAWARPAGFAFSNVRDWAKLMQFTMYGDDSVLSEAAHAEVVSSQVSTHTIYADVQATALGLGDDYGLGVGVSQGFFMDHRADPETYYPVPVLGHGGDIPGFATTFAVLPSTGFGIVVLSNRDAARPVDSIRLALTSFGELPPPSPPPPGNAVDPSRFASYAGTFVARDGGTVEVSASDGQVTLESALIDALGLPYEPVLEPTSLDNFALWVTLGEQRFPLEVTFLADESGEFGWFRSRIAVARRATGGAVAP